MGTTSIYERLARAHGWMAEKEYNGEDDGVRSENGENWAEDWEGACKQDGLTPAVSLCPPGRLQRFSGVL